MTQPSPQPLLDENGNPLPPLYIGTRQGANLSLMVGIVLIAGAAIMLPLGIFLAFFGIGASIGFIVAGVVVAGGAYLLVRIGRCSLARLANPSVAPPTI